jgi:hypothetical protein
MRLWAVVFPLFGVAGADGPPETARSTRRGHRLNATEQQVGLIELPRHGRPGGVVSCLSVNSWRFSQDGYRLVGTTAWQMGFVQSRKKPPAPQMGRRSVMGTRK